MTPPRRRLRVLMTADTVGGVWTYATDLAGALGPHGIDVCLATMGARPSDEQRRIAAAIPNLRLFESAYRLEWMEDPWDDVAAAGRWLLGLAARLRPDIVHLNGYAHAALAWNAPVLVAAHSCVLSWWEAVRGGEPPPSWVTYRRVVARGLACAGAVVAPSRSMMDALTHHYGMPRDGCVIPNGCAPERFAARSKQDYIFAAGRLWDEGKNLAALDRAAARLAWPVLVAGDARHPDGGAIVPRHVQPLGRLAPEALAERLAAASVYALPARYEPFGLSVLEAAAAGCALVLGDIPSLRGIWDGAALFVPPNDDAKLAQALGELIASKELRCDFGERARRRAALYPLARMAESYAALYREMARALPPLARTG